MQFPKLFMSAVFLWALPGAFAQTTSEEQLGRFDLLDDHSNIINTTDYPADYNLLKDGVTLTYFQGTNEIVNEKYTGNGIGNPGGTPSEETPDYYILDFKAKVYIEKVTFQWEGATLPLDYVLSVSDDAGTWTDVATISRESSNGNYDNFRVTDPLVPVRGRYLKVVITKGLHKSYHPRIDLWRVQRQRIPTTLELSSELTSPGGQKDGWVFFSEAGLSTKIKATVKDQLNKVMTPTQTINMTKEGDPDGSLVEQTDAKGEYVYTPSESFTGNVTLSSSCGNASAAKTITIIDESKYYTFGATSATSTAPTEQDVNKLFDGGESRDAHGAEYTFAADDANRTEGADHSITVTLQRPVTIEAIRLYWGGAPIACTVSVSTDGQTFTEVGSSEHSNGVYNFWEAFGNINLAARYIKIDTKDYAVLSYGLKLHEIKIYGDATESVPTSIQISSTSGTALAKGESTTFRAEVLDQYGCVIPGYADRMTWSHTTISGHWDENTLTYTAGDHVAGGEGVTFTASCNVGEGENAKTLSADINLKGFNIDHYLFDASLHEEDLGIMDVDLKKEAAAAVRTSTNDPNGRPDATALFDGGKELTQSGGGYRFLIVNSNREAKGQIIVKLYDPVIIEAIILRWDAACPANYKVEISNHGEVWGTVAEYKDIERIPNGQQFNHRMCVRYDRPITYIRITTDGLDTDYGAQLMDIKAYGTYAKVDPAALTLNPYVKVAYTSGSGENEKTVINDHPNTVVFFSEQSGGQFSEETIYLNPVFLTANGADLRVRDRKIDYTVTKTDDQASEGTESFAIDPTAHTIKFKEAGTYRVEASYTAPDNTSISATTELKAVHHNYMLTADYNDVAVTLTPVNPAAAEHQDAARAKEILMSGRTDRDGGVAWSVNLFSKGELYDAVFDFGTVIDVPAVEIYWEGACPKRYTLTFSRDENFSEESSATNVFEDPLRHAMIDRPRFDRFAVEVPAYHKPAAVMSRADGDVSGKEPQEGSTTAIRYAKLHVDELDPWMGDVWGAKLAEVTPYFDPETTGTLPTGIVNVGADAADAAPVEYYNLYGVRVDNPAAGQILIRRQGVSVSKVIIR